MNKKNAIQTRLGSVAYSVLGTRHSTLYYFFRDFKIDYLSHCVNVPDNDADYDFKELRLTPNFVFFLIENKTFIGLYQQDYYKNKSIEIISNIISKKEEEVSGFLKSINKKIDPKYPYKYLSSYAIDYHLDQENSTYKFLRYERSHRYEGNFEFRRSNFNN